MYISDGEWSLTVGIYATLLLTYKVFHNIVLPCTPVITTPTPISGQGITVCGCQCLWDMQICRKHICKIYVIDFVLELKISWHWRCTVWCSGLRPQCYNTEYHDVKLCCLYSESIWFCCVGGANSTGLLDVVEYYSIQSNEWCELARLPLAVEGAGAVFLNRQLYVVGGRSKTNYESRAWVCYCSVTMNEIFIMFIIHSVVCVMTGP